jgi:transposase
MPQGFWKVEISLRARAASAACLKKIPSIVDKASVKKICVDGFALRRRFSYGTVMAGLESHRIIDLIPSRKAIDVSRWLDSQTSRPYPGMGHPLIRRWQRIPIRKQYRPATGPI